MAISKGRPAAVAPEGKTGEEVAGELDVSAGALLNRHLAQRGMDTDVATDSRSASVGCGMSGHREVLSARDYCPGLGGRHTASVDRRLAIINVYNDKFRKPCMRTIGDMRRPRSRRSQVRCMRRGGIAPVTDGDAYCGKNIVIQLLYRDIGCRL
jgi:hypothetical protein